MSYEPEEIKEKIQPFTLYGCDTCKEELEKLMQILNSKETNMATVKINFVRRIKNGTSFEMHLENAKKEF